METPSTGFFSPVKPVLAYYKQKSRTPKTHMGFTRMKTAF
jgi:hypothetical protein